MTQWIMLMKWDEGPEDPVYRTICTNKMTSNIVEMTVKQMEMKKKTKLWKRNTWCETNGNEKKERKNRNVMKRNWKWKVIMKNADMTVMKM